MNTPPPENEFPKPEPVPSLSMPVLQPPLTEASTPPNYRRRRHTITRPDATVELLSDCDDNEHEDQALDRISGILSTLLQEANEAVQNNGAKPFASNRSRTLSRPRPHSALLRSSTTTTVTTTNSNTSSSRPKSILSLSRLPRPTRSSQYRQTHDRHSSISSSASSASLFSPVPTTAESPITASSVEQHSNYFLDRQQNYDKDSNNCDYDIIARSPMDMLQQSASHSSFGPIYYSGTDMTDETRQTHDDDHDIQQIEPSLGTPQYILPRFDAPLMESFRRLDSSMAMVESLSRDLAQQQQQDDDEDGEMASLTAAGDADYRPRLRFNSFISSTSTSKLTLLFLPLLHIPHALITTVFDTLISSPGNTQTTTWKWSTSSSSFVNASSSFSGIVAWTLCFALANILVTWSGAPSPYRFLTQQQHSSSSADIVRPRRLSLPGSYQPNNNNNNNNNSDSGFIIGRDNSNSIFEKDYSHRMERSKRPTPINTTLCVKKPSTYHSVRRTPIKRSTPFASSSSARKRISNSHQRQSPSAISMAISQSNDRSYALAIQQSRAWKKQQEQQQQQQIPDGWEWMDGDSQQPFIISRRRHSF